MGWLSPVRAARSLPALLAAGRFSFSFDAIPFEERGLPWRKRLNLARTGLDLLLRPRRVLARPAIIQVEPTNTCQLRCPLCPTGRGSATRPRGFIDPALFESLLDQIAADLLLVVLYGWGEPTLHPELPRLVAACARRGVRSFTSTNGQGLQSAAEAEALVASGLDALVIAVDGSTEEHYRTYRRSGTLEKARRCIGAVEAAKARLGSSRPYTNLRVVVTRENEDELPALRQMARELGVNLFSTKSLGCLVAEEDFERLAPSAAASRRSAPPARAQAAPLCPYVFRQPTVFWDGTVVGCEFDYGLERPLGDLRRQSFREIWNGPAARDLRSAVTCGGRAPDFCGACPYPGRSGRSVIRGEELRPGAAPAR